MAYDRYDPEERWRERSRRDRDDRGSDLRERARRDRDFSTDNHDRERAGERGERGFFERMGDEMRSWFGDEERARDARLGDDDGRWRRREGFSERDYNRDYDEELGRGSSGLREGRRSESLIDDDRGLAWDRDPYRRTSFAGSRARSNHDDLHYEEWRRRQVEDLDRDYDDYRRERQSRFEDDFGSWRERRQSKRDLMRGIREHMEVVGSDDQHVGSVDRVVGDRIILTRSDPQSSGAHHSLSCTDIDRVEGNRVILECSAEKARERWRDESRSRALFEREDQGSAGPHILDRSFSGTYR